MQSLTNKQAVTASCSESEHNLSISADPHFHQHDSSMHYEAASVLGFQKEGEFPLLFQPCSNLQNQYL